MKILHVCKKYPNAMGGDAVVVAHLAQQQREAGNELAIVTSNCSEIVAAPHVYKIGLADTPARLDVITPRRLVSLIMLAFRMFPILQKERPDVIHTHSVDMAFFVSFAARFYHIPMIHTFHIVTFYDERQSALRRKSELWLAKHAHLEQITAPNMYDVEQLRAAGLTQATLLPNGVDVAFWVQDGSAKDTAETHADTDLPFIFLAVGRLEHQKGYEYLVKAAARLVKTTAGPFEIVIVGDGSQQAALRQQIHDAKLDDTILLVGKKDTQEVRALLAHAGAAVFPSLYETTPLTLLEAWAAGVPAIVTTVGIVRDAPLDFEAAYVVPLRDEQALAQAMGHCMADAQHRTLVAKKGQIEAQKYAWPVITKTAEMLYRSAL